MSSIREKLARPLNESPAKNLILFLGDGMSIATVTAARVYLGQLADRPGEDEQLSFEQFPYTGLSKTYCVDSQVSDSACTATAFLAGVKNNINTIGVTADVEYKDWRAMQDTSLHTSSILQWAQEAGKGTGVVTTCRVTDASPTGNYAHVASRWWETDQDILQDAPEATGVQDIASQLVESSPGKNIKVILGGGRQVFLPMEKQDGYGYNGTRGDGKDLITAWQTDKVKAKVNGRYITNREQLLGVDVNNTDYLLGLFHNDHMEFHLHADPAVQPTLAEMTSLAIRMMQKETHGYYLFIEGGRIDHGHHYSQAHLALDETVEFHKAIQTAVRMTSELDTLIVVTADHAHTMTISGYPTRGSDIFATLQNTTDDRSYPTLSYANGPTDNTDGHGGHRNLSLDDRGHVNYTFPTIFKLDSETHDGQDVGVWAHGPWAHLLTGNYEQTLIPHVMGYAAGIGPAAQVVPAEVKSSSQGVACLTIYSILIVTLMTVKH